MDGKNILVLRVWFICLIANFHGMSVLFSDDRIRINDEICQPDQPRCVSSFDSGIVGNWRILHGLVLRVSFQRVDSCDSGNDCKKVKDEL